MLVLSSKLILLNDFSQPPVNLGSQLLQIIAVTHLQLSDFSLTLHYVLWSEVSQLYLQGGLGHHQLLPDVPLGTLGPSELDGGPLGPNINVCVDWRHCDNILGKITFFK